MLLAATPYLRIMSPPLVAYSSALFSSSSCCVTSSLSTTARRHDWRRIMIRNNNIFNNKNWWRDGVVKCNSSGSRRVFGQSKKKKEKKNKDPPNNINTNTNSAPGLSLSSPPGSDKSPNKLRTNNTTDFQFEQRLQAIKRSALEQKKLDQQTAQYGAIDYDQTNTTNKDPPPKTIGLPAKIGIGVAVVIFGLVFALGDFLPTTPTGPSNEAAVVDSQLSEEERKTLQARLEQFEATLTANPKDPMAVEGAAVTLAELGEYSRAASLLEDLTKMKPNDPDAFRLLGEVQYQLKDYKGSAASYKRSAMVGKMRDGTFNNL